MNKFAVSLLTVLSLSTGLFAASIPEGAQKTILGEFSNGLVNNITSNKVQANSAKYTRNFYNDEKMGSLVQFNGFQSVGSTPTLIDGRFGYTYYHTDGTKEFIVSDGSIVLTTHDFRSYTKLIGALNRSFDLDMETVDGKVWATNGTDPVWTYDGSTVVVLNGNTYGSLSTPNVPKGKYVTFYQGRVMIGNVSGNNSTVFYSDVVSTSGRILSPDDPEAWTYQAINYVDFGLGDGSQITAQFRYRNGFFVSKDRSIWKLNGNKRINYVAEQVQNSVGFVSNDSIVEQDNLVYGQAVDGIYAFDGADVRRQTDLISDDVDNFQSDTSRLVSDTWDTLEDFARGTFVQNSTATSLNVAQLSVTSYSISDTNNLNPSTETYRLNDSTSTGFMIFSVSVASPNFNGYVGRYNTPESAAVLELVARSSEPPSTCGSVSVPMSVTIKNNRTGQEERKTNTNPNVGDDTFNGFGFTFSSGILFNAADVTGTNLRMRVEISSEVGCSGQFFEVKWATRAGLFGLQPANTGQYISDIATVSVINAWGLFNSVANTNGGSINYYTRVATSSVNISTYPWNPISPGVVLPYPASSNYIQWAATISRVSISTNPDIDLVSISHIEGSGSLTKSFSTSWRNRAWFAVSTEATGNFPLIYVKAKATSPNPMAWMVADSHRIRSMFKDGNETFYAGASTSGVFYRLDYGTNFDGVAIDAIWDTPDMLDGDPFVEKKIYQYMIDADMASGLTLSLGTSFDGGSYNYNTISLDGTGRKMRSIDKVNNGGRDYGRTVSFRIRNNTLDKLLKFHTLGYYWNLTNVKRP